MTYVREQTSEELKAHMERMQAMPGWHEPLCDRLWQEVQTLQRENDALKHDKDAIEHTVGGVPVDHSNDVTITLEEYERLLQDVRDLSGEVNALKHDLARHVAIASEEATRADAAAKDAARYQCLTRPDDRHEFIVVGPRGAMFTHWLDDALDAVIQSGGK